mgnify:CR=1 FL=1
MDRHALKGNPDGVPIIYDPKNPNNYYDKVKDIIRINPFDWETADSYMGVTLLAHEVAHAFSIYHTDLSVSLEEYVRIRNMGEGEALYYQFLAHKEIYGDSVKYPDSRFRQLFLTLWKDNEDEITNAFGYATEDHYGVIEDIIADYSHDTEEMYRKLGELKADHVIGGPTSYYTYDEQDKALWLLTNTDIGLDYLKARGRYNHPTTLQPFTRETARDIIWVNVIHSWDFKVLVNKAHDGREAVDGNLATDYFGTDYNDILYAEKNGSVLGSCGGSGAHLGSGLIKSSKR